jgi:hypothetical protein
LTLNYKEKNIMERLYDKIKIDAAIAPVSLASTSATSLYYRANEFRKLGFIISAAAIAATKTVVAQVVQATDSAGTSSKNVTSATATITANSKVKRATLTLSGAAATNTCVINGLTFTGAAATSYSDREFIASGTDTQDAAALVLCVNHATYGVPGVTASNASGVVTLTATEPGDISISVTGGTNITAATLDACAYIEINAEDLDKNNGFKYAAITVTTDATIVAGVNLIRGDARYSPIQYFADEYKSV